MPGITVQATPSHRMYEGGGTQQMFTGFFIANIELQAVACAGCRFDSGEGGGGGRRQFNLQKIIFIFLIK